MYSHPDSKLWRRIEYEVIRPMVPELKAMAVKGTETYKLVTLDELLEKHGLDFSSPSPARALLYQNRVYLFGEYQVWYRASYKRGLGLLFTAHGWIGNIWFDYSKTLQQINDFTKLVQSLRYGIECTKGGQRKWLNLRLKSANHQLSSAQAMKHEIEQSCFKNGNAGLLENWDE